ncbi:MAG: methyltransferase [Oscillospiraceae bacterium]|nr:methyltransferase [Oscillospiraceae bacterium]
MDIPAFDPKELTPSGWAFSMSGRIPVFSYPVPVRDAYISFMRDRKPIWQLTGNETRIFTPRIIPDNKARAFVFEAARFDSLKDGGGFDMFGVEWEYVPVAGGSMEKPGQIMLEDMNDWESTLVWPDPDSWDWEGSAKENAEYVSGDTALQVWFQTGWFERLISFMEFEGAIMALIDEDQKDAIKAFFTKLGDLYIDMIDHYVHYFPQTACIYMHDDWGSQKETFFSPSIVEEMIVPYMKKVTDHIHSIGRVAELHSCGQIFKQVPNIIAAGWDTWSGQAMNDTHKIYELYGDKLVVGVIPEQYDANALSEEEQRAKAREFAEKFCRPDKPCVINNYGASALTLPYREELYKQSRILFGK